MLIFRNLSLRRKLTLIIMLTSSVGLLLACAAFVAFDVLTFRRELVQSASGLAEVVGNNTTAALDFNDPAAAAQTLTALRGDPNLVRAHIFTPDGRTFATYVREGTPPPADIPRSLVAGHEFTARHLHLFRPVMQGGDQVGTIVLVAELSGLSERLWRYAGLAVLILVVALLAAFGLSNRLQKLVSDPILHLAQVARSVALEKNYSLRATKQSGDELGQLVDGLNEMLGQIQQRDAALQSASAELELRVAARTAELADTNEALQTENTSRRQAQETLRESEEKFRQLAASIADVFYLTSPDLQQMHYVSPAYEQIWGRSVESLYANPGQWAEAILPDDRERVWTIFSGLATGVASVSAEFRIARPDGAVRWILSRGFQVRDVAGQVIRITGNASDITERKRVQGELDDTHRQLVDASRRGGMAEIATNVLHNVGNVLNSVNISTTWIMESVKTSKVSRLARVVALLREHAPDLGEFITQDAKGKQLPAYLAQLSEQLLADQAALGGELDSLRRNVEHIKEIVAMQQSYATFGGVKEMINLVHLVEDSLRMNDGALNRHRVEVVREFEAVPPLNVEKHKILQILVNLLRNAKHACQDSERADKRLTVRVANGAGRIKISVMDNGVGIPPENLTRIFNFGFTTRKDGHGFGLHSGALAAKAMDGSLTAHSDGPGRGAIFTLELPCEPPGRTSPENASPNKT